AFSSFKEQLKDHVFQSMTSFQQARGIDLMLMRQVGVKIYDAGVPTFTIVIKGVPRVITVSAFEGFMESRQTDALLIARSVAVDYASLCSLANMKKIIFDALAKTKPEVDKALPGSPVVSGAIVDPS